MRVFVLYILCIKTSDLKFNHFFNLTLIFILKSWFLTFKYQILQPLKNRKSIQLNAIIKKFVSVNCFYTINKNLFLISTKLGTIFATDKQTLDIFCSIRKRKFLNERY